LPGIDRTIQAIGGIVLAIVVLVVVVVLAVGEPDVVEYAPDTPEGTIQRYLRAAYDGDDATARALLSERASSEMGDDPFNRWYCRPTDGRQVRIDDVTSDGQRAAVRLRTESVSGSGLGFDRYSYDQSVVLLFENDGWKIDEPYFCV
jgi:hypothetical protein